MGTTYRDELKRQAKAAKRAKDTTRARGNLEAYKARSQALSWQSRRKTFLRGKAPTQGRLLDA